MNLLHNIKIRKKQVSLSNHKSMVMEFFTVQQVRGGNSDVQEAFRAGKWNDHSAINFSTVPCLIVGLDTVLHPSNHDRSVVIIFQRRWLLFKVVQTVNMRASCWLSVARY